MVELKGNAKNRLPPGRVSDQKDCGMHLLTREANAISTGRSAPFDFLLGSMNPEFGGMTQVEIGGPECACMVFNAVGLAEGTYHLEVRARMGSGTSARELRIGRLDSTLTAIPAP